MIAVTIADVVLHFPKDINVALPTGALFLSCDRLHRPGNLTSDSFHNPFVHKQFRFKITPIWTSYMDLHHFSILYWSNFSTENKFDGYLTFSTWGLHGDSCILIQCGRIVHFSSLWLSVDVSVSIHVLLLLAYSMGAFKAEMDILKTDNYEQIKNHILRPYYL